MTTVSLSPLRTKKNYKRKKKCNNKKDTHMMLREKGHLVLSVHPCLKGKLRAITIEDGSKKKMAMAVTIMT